MPEKSPENQNFALKTLRIALLSLMFAITPAKAQEAQKADKTIESIISGWEETMLDRQSIENKNLDQLLKMLFDMTHDRSLKHDFYNNNFDSKLNDNVYYRGYNIAVLVSEILKKLGNCKLDFLKNNVIRDETSEFVLDSNLLDFYFENEKENTTNFNGKLDDFINSQFGSKNYSDTDRKYYRKLYQGIMCGFNERFCIIEY